MTKEELKKLSRLDLIEMLLEVSKENEQLRSSLEASQKQLESRTISVENSGNLAEASLKLNGVMEAAQAAADQFLENIRMRKEQQQQICDQMERDTQELCDRMIQSARSQVDDYLDTINRHVREISSSYAWKPVVPTDRKNSGE